MRKLTLEKETLAELSDAELDVVAGGSGLSCAVCVSHFQECVTGRACHSLATC